MLHILHLSLGASIGIMSHYSILEVGIARRCRVSIASPLSIVGSRLMGHLVGRMLHLVVVIVALILLLSLFTNLISRVGLGTLLVVVAGATATSLLLRRAEFPLLILHLTALALKQ
jgi:hypothetical protein